MEEQAQQKKEETIQITKSTLWQIVSGVLGLLLIVSVLTSGFGFGGSNGSPTGGTVVQPTNGGTVPTGIVDVSADNDPSLGKDNAPVTVIEFSDFQCPFCSRFRDQTFDQIKTNYIDTGKIKFVYRDFPLSSIHPMAENGAEAAECANEQGKFWEMHDVLFAKQDEWTTTGVSALKGYAKDLGLDTDKFNSCLDSNKYKDEIAKDFQDGVTAGVQGTPSFFINGKQLSGAQPFTAFQTAIDAELKA